MIVHNNREKHLNKRTVGTFKQTGTKELRSNEYFILQILIVEVVGKYFRGCFLPG